MSVGLVVAVVVLVALAVWGALAFRNRTPEASEDTSPYYESGAGQQGGGPPDGNA